MTATLNLQFGNALSRDELAELSRAAILSGRTLEQVIYEAVAEWTRKNQGRKGGVRGKRGTTSASSSAA